MLLPLRKNGLTSLFKEVRVFKERIVDFDTFLKGFRGILEGVLKGPRLTP